jgi:hypothetical protein
MTPQADRANSFALEDTPPVRFPATYENMSPTKVLWIYIILLVIGGLIGFFKGKSRVSLIMSVSFAPH